MNRAGRNYPLLVLSPKLQPPKQTKSRPPEPVRHLTSPAPVDPDRFDRRDSKLEPDGRRASNCWFGTKFAFRHRALLESHQMCLETPLDADIKSLAQGHGRATAQI